MGLWWDTQAASAAQALHKDPSLALDTANTPDQDLLGRLTKVAGSYSDKDYEKDKEAAQKEAQDPGWFGKVVNAVSSFGDGADDVANSITGGNWDGLQDGLVVPALKFAWSPVDKAASGVNWAYQHVIARPLSTTFTALGRADLGTAGYFDAKNWTDSWDKSKNLSAGQAIANYENTAEVVDPTLLSGWLGGGADNLSKEERDTVKRNIDRSLYDTDFWRYKTGWQYTVGTGALDFALIMGADPTVVAAKVITPVVKGVRSVEFAEKEGQLVRTRGKVADKARAVAGKRPETINEVANGKKMQDFYDWVVAPGADGAARKTADEIAQHPIWGRGRRSAKQAKYQLSAVYANMDRADMPAMYRFAAGDQTAASELMSRGTNALNDIGRVADDRTLVDSINFDPTVLAYFAEREGVKAAAGAVKAPPLALSPKALQLHERAAKEVVGAAPRVKINAAGTVSKAFLRDANSWKAAQLQLIDQEVAQTEGVGAMLRTALGENLGKAEDEFSTAIQSSHLFGSLPRAYRMGEGSFRDVSKAADAKYARRVANRKGVFSAEGVRKGFYRTPIRFVQTFGDKTPQGRINHNDMDAIDRVQEMLREVPNLGADTRTSMLTQYATAGDKTAKSRALEDIQYNVLTHLAQNVHGLHPEIADILAGLTRAKMEDVINALSGKTVGSSKFGTKQAFSSAMQEGAAKTVDHVEDGVGWTLGPLAKTQLSQTDSLLPIKEINRVLARNSGALRTLTRMGAKPIDVVRIGADSFNTFWKGVTLLRPAYTARMVSEELAAAAIKFGFMSHIINEGTRGAENFVLNRGQWLNAELGGIFPGKNAGSYSPTTGKGVDSRFAVVSLGDEDVIKAVAKRKAALEKEIQGTTDKVELARLQAQQKNLRTTRIRVNKALPVIDARLTMERTALSKVESQLDRFTKKRDAILANAKGGTLKPVSQRAYDNHQLKVQDLEKRIKDHNEVIDEFSQYSNHVLKRAAESAGRRIGEESYTYRGQQIHQPFSKEWQNPISRSQFDAEGEYAATAIYARTGAIDKERLISSGSWDYITPDQPQHMGEWLNALNHQWAQDDVFRLVMEDPTGKKALEYLKTPAGRQHRADIGGQGRDPVALVKNIGLTLDKYIPESTGLRAKLLAGEDVTKADLTSAIPFRDFPVVHGQEVLDKTALWGKHQPGNIIDAAVKNGFKRLGAIPSSIMSRNPVYVKFHEGRMKELIDSELRLRVERGASETMTPKELDNLHLKADKLARKDMAQIVYDPQRTTASEALRFIAPFYSAHADGLARWGGLIAEKPEYIGKLARIYNAPVAANMVTDTQGNLVGKDGYVDIHDPSTATKENPQGKVVGRKFVPIQDRVMHFKAPWAKKGSGDYPIKIQAMNTILPGDPWWNPGSGPLVQVAGSQIAKASPSTGDFLQWAKILPYGPSDSAVEAVTPKYMRTIWDAYKGSDPDGEEYNKAYVAIWNRKREEYMRTGEPPDPKEIEQEAKNFLYMNVLEAWAFPAQSSNTPLTGTPYQFFVDQLAQAKKLDPENGADIFLKNFGADHAGFTAMLTKSMGIAATISADQQADKYRDQISADPDMAAFWVGDVYNGGPFSSSVYAKQLGESFGGTKARERVSAQEAIERSQVTTGWSEYNKGKLWLDGMLIRNGFKSYSQKGAEQYAAAKKQLVSGVGARFPAWDTAFSTVDRGKVPQRIRSFQIALQDEKLTNDPSRRDIPVLAEYLQGRAYFKQALASRGLSEVSYDVSGRATGEAADIASAWDQFRTGLSNKSIAFNQLMNRYLSNDDLQ